MTLQTSMSLVDVFKKATSVEGLSDWLAKIAKAEVRTSGKIHFEDSADQSLALFSSVELGKHAIINSELFGEIELNFKSVKSNTIVDVAFKKMTLPEDRDAFIEVASAACHRLSSVLGAEK